MDQLSGVRSMAVLIEFVEYYKRDRPHRTQALGSPVSRNPRGPGRSHHAPLLVGCTTSTSVRLELDGLLPPYDVAGI